MHANKQLLNSKNWTLFIIIVKKMRNNHVSKSNHSEPLHVYSKNECWIATAWRCTFSSLSLWKCLAAGPGTRADVPAEEQQQQSLTIPTLGQAQLTGQHKGMS